MNDERRREDAEWLLKDAAILYERHKPDRPKPFNVFDVLLEDREAKHEVNHSRFIAALLRHRNPGEEGAANLRDFMGEFAPEPLRDFAPEGAKVERERHHIDILITNDRGQALAIENKIDARDQPLQLKGYRDELARQGYKDIHLLYLTIDGREPSENSREDLGEKDYTSISYKDILGWLERCRKRACDEPALRESVGQYLRLIEKLTDKDKEGSELMKELKELCLRDNNLLVAHHLAEALIHAKASLMHDMWEKIKSVLEENSFDDPVDFADIEEKRPSNISESRIINVLNAKPPELAAFGLYYSFGQEPACLGVQADKVDGFIVGVYCKNAGVSEEKYHEIRDRLEKPESKIGRGRKPTDGWPWWCVLEPGGTGFQPGHIEILADENKRNELAERIANSAVEKLSIIRDEFATANS